MTYQAPSITIQSPERSIENEGELDVYVGAFAVGISLRPIGYHSDDAAVSLPPQTAARMANQILTRLRENGFDVEAAIA